MLAVRHPEGFAFVSADHRGLPRPTDRRLIRSHCMRGKNKRQQAKASSKPLELDPRRGTHRVPDVSKTPNAAIEEQHPTTLLSWNASMVDTITEQQRIKAVLSHSVVPLPSPHDLSLIRLVVELDTRSQALLFKCQFYHNIGEQKVNKDTSLQCGQKLCIPRRFLCRLRG